MSDVDVDVDVEAVLAVHEAWRASQPGWNYAALPAVMVKGEKFLQFNLTGQVFFSCEELSAVWATLGPLVETSSSVDVTKPVVWVDGDLAVLTSELSVLTMKSLTEEMPLPAGVGQIPIGTTDTEVAYRITEVYRRDDGEGKAEWRMWHAHYSAVPSGTKAAGA